MTLHASRPVGVLEKGGDLTESETSRLMYLMTRFRTNR